MTVTSHQVAHAQGEGVTYSVYIERWESSGPSWNSACHTTDVTLDTLHGFELSLRWLSDGKSKSYLSWKDLDGLNEITCGKSGDRWEASDGQEVPE